MAATVLQTKLFIPLPNPGQISRPALIERLSAGIAARLTLVSAPPGFGKTSLTSAWVRSTGLPAGWLSIDRGDNDPARFFSHFIAALQSIDPSLGAATRAELYASQSLSIDTLLTGLINEIAGLPGRCLLVLDDYHLIENRVIHQGLVFFLEHQPPQLHLVLLTRSDPPFPLARLRARGEMQELRVNDLRFQREEVSEFLQAAVGSGISAEDIAALETRTEGWIAGLQLAVISLKQQAERLDFIQAFTGNNRYIFDYLVEEVLAHQPAGLRRFLLQTSILDRFCGELCDAVLAVDAPGSAALEPGDAVPPQLGSQAMGSQAILEQLESSNFFLVPLDDRRCWFRYHHLFADILRHLLQIEQRDRISILHQRASEWFAARGLADEAVEHAFAAGDWQFALEKISQHSRSLVLQGEFNKLIRWVERLPETYRWADPALITFYAWALLFSGQIQAAEGAIRALEQRLQAYEIPGVRANELVLRAFLVTRRGGYAEAIRMTEEALRLVEPEDPDPAAQLIHAVALINLADNYHFLDQLSKAEKTYRQAIPGNRQVGNLLGVLGCYRNLGDIAVERARLHQSFEIYQEGIELAHAWAEKTFGAPHDLLPSAQLLMGSSEILYEWNELERAAAAIDQAVHLLEISGSTHFPGAYYQQARIAWARQEPGAVIDRMKKLRSASAGVPFAYVAEQAGWLLADLRLRLARLQTGASRGRLISEIEEWVDATGSSETDPSSYLYEPRSVMQVRALLALDRPGEAVRLLLPLLEKARSSGRQRDVLERLTLMAQAHWMSGDAEAALNVFSEALATGEAYGFLRTFLDEGEALDALLQGALQRNIAPGYSARLLAARAEIGPQKAALPGANQLLIEPLSERELEVLALVADGLSNQQIAANLVVALSTVKKHVSSILGKLGTGNRTEAVRRARDLGLI